MLLEEAGKLIETPHAPVLEPDEAIADPQFIHLRLETTAVHPVEGPVRSIRPPHRFDTETRTEVTPPPVLGEHDAEIRAELAGG